MRIAKPSANLDFVDEISILISGRVKPHSEESAQVVMLVTRNEKKWKFMLHWTALRLFVLWMLGLAAGLTIYGFIYAFLIVAIILTVINCRSDRKPVV